MKLTSVSYMKAETGVKTVIGVSFPAYDVKLRLGDGEYADAFNLGEPFDRKTHVFYIPETQAVPGAKATLLYRRFKRGRAEYKKAFSLPAPEYADPEALKTEYDNGVEIVSAQTETLAEGLTYTKYTCADREGKPVILSLLKTDLKRTALYVGTPDDGYEAKKVKQTIPDMAAAAEKNGKTVLAGVNADFFDIFGDNHPSGVCVKNGRVISNVLTDRPFVGVTKEGRPAVAWQTEIPPEKLFQAAAGMQMIVKDGALFDFAPLEPFSYVRHPRTAAGVTKDGAVLLLEADGRIPEHSNGMSLVDLGLFMVRLGADRAINLDGGGSSAVYTKTNGEFTLRTVPADLFFPNDKLIRKDFNALFVISA